MRIVDDQNQDFYRTSTSCNTSIDRCKQKILINPEDADNYDRLSNLYFESQNYVLAIRAYCKSVTLKSSQYLPEKLIDWSVEIAQNGDFDAAILGLQKVLLFNDRSALACFNLGEIYRQRSQFDRAIKYLLKALSIDCSFSIQPLNKIAIYFHKKGNTQKAIKIYENIATIKNNDGLIWYNLAILSKQLNRSKLTFDYFLKAFNYKPELLNDRDLIDLGNDIHDKMGIDALIEFKKKTILIHPNHALSYVTLGSIYHDLGLHLESQNYFFDALNRLQESIEKCSKFIAMYLGWSESRNTQISLDRKSIDRAELIKAIKDSPDSEQTIEMLKTFIDRKAESSIKSESIDSESAISPPDGFHDNTRSYVEASGESQYLAISPPRSVHLKPAISININIPPSLSVDRYDLPETFVSIIANGRACWSGNTSVKTLHASAIITPENKLLSDVSPSFPIPILSKPLPPPDRNWVFHIDRLPSCTQFDGSIAVLAALASAEEKPSSNYFHWLIDLLPRIGLLQQSGIHFDEIDYFIVDTPLTDFQKDSLLALEIDLAKVIDVSQYSHIQAQRLIVPSIAGKLTHATKWSCRFLRTAFVRAFKIATTTAKTRLYISRDRAKYRRILNEDELLGILEPLGFQCVRPETLSFEEQVRLFASAEIVIAPHGAGLTNTIFCEPGTKIVEIFSPNYILPYFRILASEAELDYFYLVGKGIDCLHLRSILYPNLMTEDLVVEIDDLRALFDLAGIA